MDLDLEAELAKASNFLEKLNVGPSTGKADVKLPSPRASGAAVGGKENRLFGGGSSSGALDDEISIAESFLEKLRGGNSGIGQRSPPEVIPPRPAAAAAARAPTPEAALARAAATAAKSNAPGLMLLGGAGAAGTGPGGSRRRPRSEDPSAGATPEKPPGASSLSASSTPLSSARVALSGRQQPTSARLPVSGGRQPSGGSGSRPVSGSSSRLASGRQWSGRSSGTGGGGGKGGDDEEEEEDELLARAKRWAAAGRGDWRWEGRPAHRDLVGAAVVRQVGKSTRGTGTGPAVVVVFGGVCWWCLLVAFVVVVVVVVVGGGVVCCCCCCW